MRAPNLATIAFPYDGKRFGGSNVSSLILASTLHEHGHTVHVLSHGDGRVRTEAEALGLTVHHLPPLSSVPSYSRPDRFRLSHMLPFRSRSRVLRELGVDILHTNDLAMLRAWALPARLSGASLLAHWRSAYSKSWSVDAALAVADAVVAVSHYARNQLPTWAQRKTFVSYNGFRLANRPADTADERSSIRARLSLPRDAAIVGTFGNHSVRKRTNLLADILHSMRAAADGRPVLGLACGEKAEPYDHLLDQKIETYGLQNRLLRPGFVRPVEEWMAACDVIIAPSVQEPLARTVLEAQCIGVPVIASTDGGLSEIIEDERAGFLCAPDDTSSWVERTRQLLDDPALARTLTAAGRNVVGQLTPERNAQDIERIYAQMLQSRHVRPEPIGALP
jgi:glycosyltransferase involved in cell wall biosynthesis